VIQLVGFSHVCVCITMHGAENVKIKLYDITSDIQLHVSACIEVIIMLQ